jgi:hypothetical protein
MTDLEVSTLLTDRTKSAGTDYLIIDVRRTDFEVLAPSKLQS